MIALRRGGLPRPFRRQVSTSTPSAPNISLNELQIPTLAAAARKWIENFRDAKLRKDDVEMSFSRSSGPGGQNVNKLNTKATARCSLHAVWLPKWALPGLRASSHYVMSTNDLLVTASTHRSQAQNAEECLKKLHSLILQHGSAPIQNETSTETKERVKKLARAQDARRLQDKTRRSITKEGRSKSNWE